mmetsp:Transcript_29674/g.62421  ORF Transcript_29674/g.62421 Transcript_29674/m.62421 type:complete len:1176 (+) Transcript_29674:528-4055(+)|eukprot:CAMPEP_0171337872 /NCGR_PEP_ID=MMETSP0878-20121228/6956_1 /TAXON_ID=67004 /ORGANISM="Thalassiosira weissflogii, Strain CCMP1336" /LENGTH=1175 /DNA_ID=CAMNT_0011839549 /DNA_START=497 /DNA_END=4024 /DNA_ORIENTATION=-
MSNSVSTSQKRQKSNTSSSRANSKSGASFSRSSTSKKSTVLAYDELAEWEVGKVLGRETPVSLVTSANEGSVRNRLSGSHGRESQSETNNRNGRTFEDPLELDIHMVAAAALAHAKAESKSNEMYGLTANDKPLKCHSLSRSMVESQSRQPVSKSKGVLAAIVNLDESQLKNSTHSYGSNESFVNNDDESEEGIKGRSKGSVLQMAEEEGEEVPTVTDDENENNGEQGDESDQSDDNEGGDEDESADSHEATFYDARTNCSKTPSESNTTITTTKSTFPNFLHKIQHPQPPPPPSDELNEPPSPKTLRAIEESQRQRAISGATQTLLASYELTPEERARLLKEVQRALDKQGRQRSLMSDAEPEDDTITCNENSTFFSNDYIEEEEGGGGESTVFTGYTGYTTNTGHTGYTVNTGYTNNTGYSSYFTNNTGYSSRYTNQTRQDSVNTSDTGNFDGDLTMTTNTTIDDDGTYFTKEGGSFFTYDESYKRAVGETENDDDDDTIAFLSGGCFRPCNPFKNWGTNVKSILPQDDSSQEKNDWNKESMAGSYAMSSARSRLSDYNRDDTLSTSESILKDLRSMDTSTTSGDEERSVEKNQARFQLSEAVSKMKSDSPTPSNTPYLRERMETIHGMCFQPHSDFQSVGGNDSSFSGSDKESAVEVGIGNRLNLDGDDSSTKQEADDENVEVDTLPLVKQTEPRSESATERIVANIDRESSEVASAATGESNSTKEIEDQEAIVDVPVIKGISTQPTIAETKNTANKDQTQSISKPSEFRREMSNAASLATQQVSNRTSMINARKNIQERIAIERALAEINPGQWRSYIDPKTGRKYYSDGKVSTWTRPAEIREDDTEEEKHFKASSTQVKMARASVAMGQWTKSLRDKMSSKKREGSGAAKMNVSSRSKTKKESTKTKTTQNSAVNVRPRNSANHLMKTTKAQHYRKLEVKKQKKHASLQPEDQSASNCSIHNTTRERRISWKAPMLNDLMKRRNPSANPSDQKNASILIKESIPKKISKEATSSPSNQVLLSTTPKKPRPTTTTKNRKPRSVVTLVSKTQASSPSSPKINASIQRTEKKPQSSKSKPEYNIPTSPARTEASSSSESSTTKTSPSPEKEMIVLQPISNPLDPAEFIKKDATGGSSVATDNCTTDSDPSAAAVLMRSTNEGGKRVTMITFT